MASSDLSIEKLQGKKENVRLNPHDFTPDLTPIPISAHQQIPTLLAPLIRPRSPRALLKDPLTGPIDLCNLLVEHNGDVRVGGNFVE